MHPGYKSLDPPSLPGPKARNGFVFVVSLFFFGLVTVSVTFLSFLTDLFFSFLFSSLV